MFNLEQIKRSSGLAPEIIVMIEQKVREDFRDDEMIAEIHLIRTIQSLKEGGVTLDQVLDKQVPA